MLTDWATMLPLLLAAVTLGVMSCAFAASPRLTLAVWALTLFFVPIWIGVQLGLFWSITAGVTAVALVTSWRRLALSPPDVLVALFLVLLTVLTGLRMTSFATFTTVALVWILPYAWGRLIAQRVTREHVSEIIGVTAVLAAMMAIVEVMTSSNLFVGLPTLQGSGAAWTDLQYRGGNLRAEGAFGHSIALGSALAVSAAFILAARWRTPVKVLALGVVGVGTALTLSRISWVTFALTVLLSVVLLPGLRRSTRVVVLTAGVAAAMAVIPMLTGVLMEAEDETGRSAEHRSNLLALVPLLRPFGATENYDGLILGDIYLGTAFANSTDNAFLSIATRTGWVPVALLAALLVLATIGLFRPGGTSPAAIALVAQVPAFFTVALITQYAVIVWFIGGLAATWGAAGKTRVGTTTRSSVEADTRGDVPGPSRQTVG